MGEKVITIFGTGRAKAGDAAYEMAYRAGKVLAEAGFVVANGGYGGTMKAAAKGATEGGGETIGVTCTAFRGRANGYVSREIVTSSLDERLDTLIKLGRAYIVLPGGTGTLLELAKVWELKNKGFLESDKPIILLGRFWKALIDLIASDDAGSSGFINQVDEAEQIRELITRI